MATKRVPVPTVGRTVMYQPTASDGTPEQVYCATVVGVDSDSPEHAILAVFDLRAYSVRKQLPILTDGFVRYGENEPGCWWWPEDSDATMEVETEDETSSAE